MTAKRNGSLHLRGAVLKEGALNSSSRSFLSFRCHLRSFDDAGYEQMERCERRGKRIFLPPEKEKTVSLSVQRGSESSFR